MKTAAVLLTAGLMAAQVQSSATAPACVERARSQDGEYLRPQLSH